MAVQNGLVQKAFCCHMLIKMWKDLSEIQVDYQEMRGVIKSVLLSIFQLQTSSI